MPSYISLHRFCNRRYKTSAEEFDRSAYCFANSTCASDITWSGFNRNEFITNRMRAPRMRSSSKCSMRLKP